MTELRDRLVSLLRGRHQPVRTSAEKDPETLEAIGKATRQAAAPHRQAERRPAQRSEVR